MIATLLIASGEQRVKAFARRIWFFGSMVVAVVLASSAPAALAAPPHYTAALLNVNNPNAAGGNAIAMSNSAIVGNVARYPDSSMVYGFISTPHERTEVFAPLSFDSWTYGVSDLSEAVGYVSGPRGYEAFFRSADGEVRRPLKQYGFSYSSAIGVNSSRTIIGSYQASPTAPLALYSYANGVLTTLPTLDFADNRVSAINNAGTIVGAVQSVAGTPGPLSAAVWSNGALSLLPGLDPGDGTEALAISSDGLIVGYSSGPGAHQQRGVIWSNGIPTDLGNLGGTVKNPDPNVQAFGVNASGDVVGISNSPEGEVSFLYTGGRMYNLRDLTSGFKRYVFGTAIAINDEGKILMQSRTPDGLSCSLVLTPDMPGQQ